jgi:hypothetical protein
LERAENIHHLHDLRYGVYERCVTYDGPEYYVESSPLRGPVLAGQIQKVCEAIVSHVSEVTYAEKQVTRIVVNLKIDSREKLWLLYTTSIRCGAEQLHGVTINKAMGAKPPQLLNIDSVVTLPPSVNLNPVPTYDEIIPKSRIQCLSCNTETLNDLRHPVTYKSIVKHYEHVLHLISSLSGNLGQNIIQWPPDQSVIDAAGGVGFGCLQSLNDEGMGRKNAILDLNKPLDSSELRIPPLLRYLHPKLSAIGFMRCRKDPLFLYKTVTVCEPCYLVYAEFTTMILRMGSDLTKLLKPDPSAVELSYTNKAPSTLTRPSSADWRALSSVNRSTEGGGGSSVFQDDNTGNVGSYNSMSKTTNGRGFKPSENHKHAKESAIGIRTSDVRTQPVIPQVIILLQGWGLVIP